MAKATVELGDILATTDNQTITSSVYTDELTITYDIPVPKKTLPTPEDLFQSDLFTFGSIIGSITNKGTSAYALLPNVIEEYGADSPEAKLLESRLDQCCVAQSKQIDKAKIGRPVKGIPNSWLRKSDDPVLNHILLDKYAYFFKYRYPEAKRSYDKYMKAKEADCQMTFGMSVEDLQALTSLTPEQTKWLKDFRHYCPLIVSNSPMNLICKAIEEADKEVLKTLKAKQDFDYTMYLDSSVDIAMIYKDVIQTYKRCQKDMLESFNAKDETVERRCRRQLSYVCHDRSAVTNCLVEYCYNENPSARKDFLWRAYGDIMCDNARAKNPDSLFFPIQNPDGEIEYLNEHYSLEEVEI